MARIIAAEVKPDSEGGGPPPEQPVQLPAGSPGALCGLFLAACGADDWISESKWLDKPPQAGCKEIVPQLLLQLSSNEAVWSF